MGALGTDGAIESAEIVLMRDELTSITKAIRLARKVHKISLQDFGNFFETRITSYRRAGVGVSQEQNSFSLDEDF